MRGRDYDHEPRRRRAARQEWAGQGSRLSPFVGTTTFAGNLVTVTIQCGVDATTEVKLVTPSEDRSSAQHSLPAAGRL